MTLALGIDIGTSGIRTAVVDGEGRVVSTARVLHEPQVAGRLNAENWWHATQACIRAQMAEIRLLGLSGKDISNVVVDGTSGSMVLTDAALRPVGPALMYNSKGFDAEAKRIAAVCPEPDHITQGANSALARAMRMLANAESVPAHLLHQADFVAAKLMHCGGHSDHNNALKAGFDPDSNEWPAWIGDLLDPSLLPRVDPVGTAWQVVDAGIARGLGLNPAAVVKAGTTDSIAAFLAASPLDVGHAVTSIGSTLAIKLLSDKRIDLPSQGLYSHRLGGLWLVGGASNSGGAVLSHFFSTDALSDLSERIDPSQPSDLDYYPLIEPGERFPINDPGLQPRMTPRPADDAEFLHGLFEGIARIEADCYQLISRCGGPTPSVVLTAGGAARNRTFSAIRARVLGLPLRAAAETEASVGAAKIAFMQD